MQINEILHFLSAILFAIFSRKKNKYFLKELTNIFEEIRFFLEVSKIWNIWKLDLK